MPTQPPRSSLRPPPPPLLPAGASAEPSWTMRLEQLLETLRVQLSAANYLQVEQLVGAMQRQEVVLSRDQFLQEVQRRMT